MDRLFHINCPEIWEWLKTALKKRTNRWKNNWWSYSSGTQPHEREKFNFIISFVAESVQPASDWILTSSLHVWYIRKWLKMTIDHHFSQFSVSKFFIEFEYYKESPISTQPDIWCVQNLRRLSRVIWFTNRTFTREDQNNGNRTYFQLL